MDKKEWYIIDTETSGLKAPRYVVDIAAQRMLGWKKNGPPFRCLVNHGVALSDEATRVHGYTKEILQKKGVSPHVAYDRFRKYVGGRLPIASYNLAFDWDQVLIPEWNRLGVAPIGERGICVLRFAQRVLSPSPAGNHKLQTLREYYDLKGGQAHSALGDVEVTVELIQKVLKEKALAEGCKDWIDLEKLIEKTFPQKMGFGKYKGRDFHDAKFDLEFRDWLRWIASKDGREAKAGQWYLKRLGYAVEKKHRSKSPTIPLSSKSSVKSPESVPPTRQNSQREERETKIGCIGWLFILCATYMAFVLGQGFFQGRANRAAEANRGKAESLEKQFRNQQQITSNRVAIPSQKRTTGTTPATISPPVVATQTKTEPEEPLIPPAEIPTGDRFWYRENGDMKYMEAVAIDYERRTVTFRHINGKYFPDYKISNLRPEDQEYLLGTKLFKQTLNQARP